MNSQFTVLITDSKTQSNQTFAKVIEDELDRIHVNFATESTNFVKTYLEKNPPDLIVLDQLFKDTSGLELIKEIKAQQRLSDIPIIVLTSQSTLQDQMELLEFGAEDYIERNSSPGIFLARIRTQIRHKLALTRLKQLAKDRDLFAAGVLHDINKIESNLVSLCQTIQNQIKESPEDNRQKIQHNLSLLRDNSKSLGQYANEVIHSVRESGKPAVLVAATLGETLNWVQSFQRDKEENIKPFIWQCTDSEVLLAIDQKFCQLAVLSLVQFCQKLLSQNSTLSIELSQTIQNKTSQKSVVLNLLQTNLTLPSDVDYESLFKISEYGASVKELEMPMVARLLQNMGSQIRANCIQEKLAFILEIPQAEL